MRSLLLSALLLSTSIGMTSCSNDKEVIHDKYEYIGLSTGEAANISSSIKEGENIQKLISQGNILSGSAEVDKSAIVVAIRRSLGSLRKLRVDSNNKYAVEQLIQQIELFNNTDTEVRDGDTIPLFFEKIGKIAFSIGARIGVDRGNTTSRAYFNDFIDDMREFTVHKEGGSWELSARNEDTMISSKGSGETWLISPTFNLDGAGLADLVITHQTRFEASRGRTLEADAANKTFQILVSTDYIKGDPNSEEVTWTSLNDKSVFPTSSLPSGRNNHTIESKFNLNDFINEDVVIAFKFKPVANLFNPYWSLYNFSLNTQKTFNSIVKREAPIDLFIENFAQDFGLFNSTKTQSWRHDGQRGNANVKVTDLKSAVLLSPRIKMKNAEEVKISIINQARELQSKRIKIQISSDYENGDMSLKTWKDIEFDIPKKDVFTNWESFFINLKLDQEDIEKPFVVRFFIDELKGASADEIWQIGSFEIQAKKGSIESLTKVENPFDSTAVAPIKIEESLEFKKVVNCGSKDITKIFDYEIKFNAHRCSEQAEGLNFVTTKAITKSSLTANGLKIKQSVLHGSDLKVKAAAIYLVPSSYSSVSEIEEVITDNPGVLKKFEIRNKEGNKDIKLEDIPFDDFRVVFAYKPFISDGSYTYFSWNIKGVDMGETK